MQLHLVFSPCMMCFSPAVACDISLSAAVIRHTIAVLLYHHDAVQFPPQKHLKQSQQLLDSVSGDKAKLTCA